MRRIDEVVKPIGAADAREHTNGSSRTATIDFGRGRVARVVSLSSGADVGAAIQELGLPAARAVIVVATGADSLDAEVEPRLRGLFTRGLVRAARQSGASVIDGGTDSGGMALVGQAVAEDGHAVRLIGVAPAGAVTYPGAATPSAPEPVCLEPNHPAFVLVEGRTWGDETAAMFEVADAVCASGRAVTVIAGGGPIARQEALRSVRREWPIVLLAGTGGLADELTALVNQRPALVSDAVLSEIVTYGKLHVFVPGAEPAQLEQLLVSLVIDVATLRDAWERLASYDYNAGLKRRRFELLQNSILVLGVIGTVLALTFAQWQQFLEAALLPLQLGSGYQLTAADVLRVLIILVPITISILSATLGRAKVSGQWLMLRGAAESIKREIYTYRVRAGVYRGDTSGDVTREGKLARQVAALSAHIMQTEVSTSSLQAYNGPIPPTMYGASRLDDGLSLLTPENYIEFRVGDQITYYRDKTRLLSRNISQRHLLILVAGGAGTFLAAFHYELWVALATATATALVAFLQYQQLEFTLVKFNQGFISLQNVQAWWQALAPRERADDWNQDKLVEAVEEILQSELTGWVQQMHDAMAKLASQDTGAHGRAEKS